MITAFAWCVILAAAGMTVVSFFALLMLIAGGDGASGASIVGFFTVVIAPPVTLVAGIALLRRRAWGRYYLVALFALVLAFNLYEFVRANPEPTHYVSPSGVPTTVLPTDRSMFVPIIVACVGALAVLLSRRARVEVAGGVRPCGFERADVVQSVPASRAIDAARTKPPSRWAVVLTVTILLGLACGMSWLVYDGIGTGETVFPSKVASQRRAVMRADEPVLFWTAIGLYAAVTLGSVGLVGWGVVRVRRGLERAHREE